MSLRIMITNVEQPSGKHDWSKAGYYTGDDESPGTKDKALQYDNHTKAMVDVEHIAETWDDVLTRIVDDNGNTVEG